MTSPCIRTASLHEELVASVYLSTSYLTLLGTYAPYVQPTLVMVVGNQRLYQETESMMRHGETPLRAK